MPVLRTNKAARNQRKRRWRTGQRDMRAPILQRVYRQNTPLNAPVKERRTTTETLLRAFATYTVLVYHRSPFLREVCPTRLTTRQRNILNRLNFSTPAQILSRRLQRLPDD